MKINSQNLKRYVPTVVREAVRKRCGFGCVICGAAWYDYEHFDPDFKDAKEHNPEGITLLCMQHNQRRARGTLSVETVRAANADPICKKNGYASEVFDFGVGPIDVFFAGTKFIDCKNIITINGVSLLSVKPPKLKGEPYLISGFFSDSDGAISLRIDENVFTTYSDNWDVECIGSRIIVKRAKGDVSIVLNAIPPNKIEVEKINMQYDGVVIRGGAGVFEFSINGGGFNKFMNGTFKSFGNGTGVVIMNK